MTTTTNTKIKDFKVGDQFKHYGATFEVTGELKTFDKDSGKLVYGRNCKYLSGAEEPSNISGLLHSYDWMQGTIEVTYCKIIS